MGDIRKKNSVDLSTMVYGKVPPQSRELEEAVLGAILLEKDAFEKAAAFLDAKYFYVDSHQRIFSAMKMLKANNQPIDYLTLMEQLKANDHLDIVGGPYAITRLTNSVVSSANIEPHSINIFAKFVKREIIRMSGEMIGMAYEDGKDALDLVDNAYKELVSLQDLISRKKPNHSFSDIVTSRAAAIIENDGSRPAGLLSGLRELDNLILAFQPSLLYVIGARPSMGKTALMVQLAKNIGGGIKGYSIPEPIGFISMETSDSDYADRHIANHTGINSLVLKKGGIIESDQQLIHGSMNKVSHELIYCDFTPGQKMSDIARTARRWKKDHGIKGLLIDYSQIIEPEDADQRKTEEQQIGIILLALLNLAKELRIAVIAFAQLNRENLKASDKRPNMSNFRGSGKIEATARAAILLHRDEYYGILEDSESRSTKNIAELILAKNNDGPVGVARVKFESHLSRFSDIVSESNPLSVYIKPGGYHPIEDEAPF